MSKVAKPNVWLRNANARCGKYLTTYKGFRIYEVRNPAFLSQIEKCQRLIAVDKTGHYETDASLEGIGLKIDVMKFLE